MMEGLYVESSLRGPSTYQRNRSVSVNIKADLLAAFIQQWFGLHIPSLSLNAYPSGGHGGGNRCLVYRCIHTYIYTNIYIYIIHQIRKPVLSF